MLSRLDNNQRIKPYLLAIVICSVLFTKLVLCQIISLIITAIDSILS